MRGEKKLSGGRDGMFVFVVLTEIVDKENRPVIAAVKMAGKDYVNSIEIDANVLTGAYGKDNFQSFIERNIKQGSVLYVDKKRAKC